MTPRPRVLIAETDEDAATSTARVLERVGYETAVTTDPSPSSLSERVACVVTEVDVLGGEGEPLQFAETVRSRRTDASIVVYTDRGSEAIASRAISIGVDEYVRKSRGSAALRRAVERVIGSAENANGNVDVNVNEIETGTGTETSTDIDADATIVTEPAVPNRRVDVSMPDDQDSGERERAQYRTIVETVGDPIYALDAEGTLTLANHALAGYVGVDREELLGSDVAELLPSEAYETGTELVRTLLRTESTNRGRYEFEITRADGTVRTLENDITVMTEDGTYRGSVGVLRDVTRRKADTRALKRQNERLDEFVGIVSHDLRNPLAIVDASVNRLAETCDAEECEKRESIERIETAVDRMDALLTDLLALAREGRDVAEFDRVSLERVVCDAWRQVETDGATLVFDDLETIDADSGRLQQLLENLFRNSVEHSSTSPPSRTQENSVEHSSTSPGSQARQNSVEHSSTSPPSRTQEDDAGQTSCEPSVADAPEDSVEHSFTSPSLTAVPNDRLERETDSTRSGLGTGTRTRESTPETPSDGSGRDEYEHGVTVTVEQLPDGFAVADDGPGIEPEDRERIFDRGFTTRTNGTGFGLSIVRRIVEAHGWSIAIDEEYDDGARFVIRTAD